MDWRQALRSRAIGVAGGRVYWTERPQGTGLPALVLKSAGDNRPQHMKGFSLADARVQFDAYGQTAKDAWDLIEATLTALIPGATANGHNFSRADVALGPRDLTERVGNETVFRVSMDLVFHHAENEEVS